MKWLRYYETHTICNNILNYFHQTQSKSYYHITTLCFTLYSIQANPVKQKNSKKMLNPVYQYLNMRIQSWIFMFVLIYI